MRPSSCGQREGKVSDLLPQYDDGCLFGSARSRRRLTGAFKLLSSLAEDGETVLSTSHGLPLLRRCSRGEKGAHGGDHGLPDGDGGGQGGQMAVGEVQGEQRHGGQR